MSFEGARVLIVEDNRANQLVAAGMLDRLNCKHDLANNGIEALQKISREHFDLVLMDCHMPDMDGYEATAQIRQLESSASSITIVAMTANVQKGESDKCLAVGMNDYLSKPLKLQNLRQVLSQWLQSKDIPVAKPAFSSNLAPASAKAAEAIIDTDTINELIEQIGDSLPAMVGVFLDDIPRYIRSLKDAVSVRDCPAVADIAHTIKGSASNFGAFRLTDACAQLESQGKHQQTENFDQQLSLVVTECHLLKEALTQQFETAANQPTHSETDDDSEDHINEQDIHSHRILIVDDDRGMRFAMRKVLEEDGYLIEEVNNGEQALMVCERMMPDLILMDAIMPEMDGFKACSEIQQLPGGKQTPVLIITALNDEVSIGRAFAAGATDYISKPVNFAVLRKRIRRLLQASRAEQYVRKLAYHDSLTGLPNRTLLTEQLNDLLNDQPKGEMSALLFLDLDRFKLVNDTYGHDAGDLLLRVVAERLQGCIRQGDMVSRFGGDEFTILLRRVKSYEAIESIAEKIHATLSRPFVFLGKKMHVNCSIGIALTPNDSQDITTLLKYADIAMYRAKTKGASFEYYDHSMEQDAARRLDIESDLRGAIERNEMVVFYQPQEDLSTGQIVGMEALVRWNHPQKGMVSPLEFIPLAEETGQILELGDWVLETACQQLKDWIKRFDCDLKVAVNLAGRQLDNNDLINRVSTILDETGLPARNLELEITESTIMHNPQSVITTLEALRSMGITLAVDDFGTGYSSLNYLKRFPIHMLKIDRSFVADITKDKTDADIVSTIITLAHSLGVKVIAEGVETREHRSFLKQEGCDYVQGYLLGEPVAAEVFESRYLMGNTKARASG